MQRYKSGDKIRYVGIATAYKNKTGHVLGYREIEGINDTLVAIIIPGFADHLIVGESELQPMEVEAAP